jgi:hypothetical protein
MSRFAVVTRLIQREPVAFQGCVQATLAALAGFGVIHWSSEQVGLLLGLIAAFLALFTRAWVSPTSGTTSPAAAHHATIESEPRVEASLPRSAG